MNEELNLCSVCLGEGEKEGKICPVCLGTGVWFSFLDKTIFFDREISTFLFIIEKIKKIFKILFKIFLILFGLFGLICLSQVLIPKAKINFSIFININQDSLIFIFWLSLLAWLFLIYLKDQEKEKKLLSQYFLKKEKINLNDFLTKSLDRAISQSFLLAKKLNHFKIEPIHLFVGLLQQEEGMIILTRLGIPWFKMKEKISQFLAKINFYKEKRKVSFSLETKKILIKAGIEAYKKKKDLISPLEVFPFLSSDYEPTKIIFDDFEVKPEDLKNVIVWKEVYEEIRKDWQMVLSGAAIKRKGPMNIAMTAVQTPFLDSFSSDLTELAKRGYLGVCLDREKEFEEIFRLLEGGKRGIVLVGPPGVGKTTIIEGLARKMVAEEVPSILSDKRLVSLSISRLVAGAERPGEIEERIQRIIFEIIKAGNIVLFIKDVHNLVGIKTTEGELDASEILAEAIEKGYCLVLASSISGSYERYLEDSALGQKLAKVSVNEPDKNTAVLICMAKVALLEAKNKVFFSYQSLVNAVELSLRYLAEKFLPDKAISLLEEVAIYVKNKKGKNSFVLKDDVAELVAKKTGIPPEKISREEREILLELEAKIHQRIIDQEEAVKAVATAIRRARTELRELKRPIVNLLFLGPTGVGKTELAKTVADIYFGSEKKMIRLDMSEFQTKESIGRLIGCSTEPRGVLTEAVRKTPFTLLLLDEIEKAHPDVLNLFLQVMDDGRLTDWQGRTVDFTNLILIGTSNAASDWLQEQLRQGKTIDEIKEVFIKEKLLPYFKPEFLNRFDGIIIFKSLGINELKEITRLLLSKLAKTLETKGINLLVTEEAIDELAQEGFDPVFGARELKRVIQEKVNDAIANYLLTGKISRRDLVILEKGGKIRVEKRL